MAEISGNGGDARDGAVVVNLKEEDEQQQQQAIHKPLKKQDSLLSISVPFLQKVFYFCLYSCNSQSPKPL